MRFARVPINKAEPVGDSRWTVWGICVFLAVIVFAVFGQTVHYDFVNYDDGYHVYQNPEITGGLTLKGILWAFRFNQLDYWHPLDFLSHMLDCQIYGLQPGGHHLTNVLLHATVAVLLFLVLRQMTNFLWRSAFVAAVFAIHPLRVESVAWVSERKDMLQGLFFMLTIGAYVHYVRKPRSWARYLAVVLSFGLGLMCKPTLMTLPFVLLLLDYWPLRRFAAPEGPPDSTRGGAACFKNRPPGFFRLVIEKVPLAVLSMASCVQAAYGNREAFTAAKEYPHTLQIANALVSYVDYIWQMICPAKLALLYPFPEHGLPAEPVILSTALLVIISTGVFVLRRKYPCLLIGWLWYMIMLAPMIGFVQAGEIARADRYTYLPQTGLYLLLTWAVADISSRLRYRRLLLSGLAGGVLAALILSARSQTVYWKNSITLWTHTLACTGNNAIAENNLGNALASSGQADEAIPHLQRAVEIEPDNADANCNFGSALGQIGRTDEAVIYLRKAIKIQPKLAMAYSSLGNIFFRKGQTDAAIGCFRKAIDILPDFVGARDNLGYALLASGQVREAVLHFQRSLEIQPNNIRTCKNLAWIQATWPEASIRNGTNAIRLAKQAVKLADGNDPLIIGTLAAAYAEAGQYSNAVMTAKSAQQMASQQSNTELVDELRYEIGLYQANSPLRDDNQTVIQDRH